jgi:hypothetical protein
LNNFLWLNYYKKLYLICKTFLERRGKMHFSKSRENWVLFSFVSMKTQKRAFSAENTHKKDYSEYSRASCGLQREAQGPSIEPLNPYCSTLHP